MTGNRSNSTGFCREDRGEAVRRQGICRQRAVRGTVRLRNTACHKAEKGHAQYADEPGRQDTPQEKERH